MNADSAAVRRLAYTLMIAVAVAVALGRIFSAERVYEPHLSRDENDPNDFRSHWPTKRPDPMPTFSSNDRSRWATVRALVDDGTYVIGRRKPITIDTTSLSMMTAIGVKPAHAYKDEGIVVEPGYETFDKVLNPATQEFYSSKPPLLPTMVAGEYWLLKRLFGWDIVRERWQVVGVVLVTINVLPLILYLVLLARLVERFGTTDWGKLFVVAAACFGTLMTPFLNTFNNHTLGTFFALFTLYVALTIPAPRADGWRTDGLYVVAGLCAGFTACNELPALAFTGLLGALLFLRSPWRAVVLYGGAALLPLAALELTNYLALGQWRPAYSEFGGPWYEYEGSHWLYIPGVSRGIDWAGRNGETKLVYAFHLLLGHHGFFSLTPIYLLGLIGMGWAVRQLWKQGFACRKIEELSWAEIGSLTLVLSWIIIGYYIYKSDNYGGFSNGPRWLMWLSPLWLLTMLPAVERLGQSRWGRLVALILLGISVFSASYSAWNPWRHPWIYDWMNSRHWIAY
jgi:hypothetical protein